jgi:hypothetical protein
MGTQYAHLVLLERQGRYEEASTVLEAFLASCVRPCEWRYRDLIAAQTQHLYDRVRADIPAVEAPQLRFPAVRRPAIAAPIPTHYG